MLAELHVIVEELCLKTCILFSQQNLHPPIARTERGSVKEMHPEMDNAYYVIRHDVRSNWSVS